MSSAAGTGVAASGVGTGLGAAKPAVQLLVASRNAKKVRELERVLAGAQIAGIELVSLTDVPEFPEVPETGATFTENALIKAREAVAATGLACVADDSGLTVDALNGMPGVLSARWSGTHGNDAANNELLLAQMIDVPEDRRGAAFISVCALVVPGGGGNIETRAARSEYCSQGIWAGRILGAPRGSAGFGYDPLFLPSGEQRCAAELSPKEKDAASHRGQALAGLLPALSALAAGAPLPLCEHCATSRG